MKTGYVYKGRVISHIYFIHLCNSIGIHGGRKESAYQVLKRKAEQGDERAKEVYDNLRVY